MTPSSSATAAAYSGVFDLTTAVREEGATVDVPKRTPVRLDVQVSRYGFDAASFPGRDGLPPPQS
ncbi:MAG TPA: hypothetical protein VFY98_10435 [Intrasporangium sp.]|nr:hypothetical protein [Intrasporangium sp.]